MADEEKKDTEGDSSTTPTDTSPQEPDTPSLFPYFSDVEGNFRRHFGDFFRRQFGEDPNNHQNENNATPSDRSSNKGSGEYLEKRRANDKNTEDAKTDGSRNGRNMSDAEKADNNTKPNRRKNEIAEPWTARGQQSQNDGMDDPFLAEIADDPPNRPRTHWDERCFQWCSQTTEGRSEGSPAVCRMVCLRRKEKRPEKSRWNVFEGLYLYRSTGRKACFEHIDGMNREEVVLKEKQLPFTKDTGQETDLGEAVQASTEKVFAFYRRSFSPGINTLKQWPESFTNGTQAEFFNRFYEAAKRGDSITVGKNALKRLWDMVGGRGKDE